MALTTVSSLSESFTSGIPVAPAEGVESGGDAGSKEKSPSDVDAEVGLPDSNSNETDNGNTSSRIEEVVGPVGNEEGEKKKQKQTEKEKEDGAVVGSDAAVVAMDTTEELPPKEGDSEPAPAPSLTTDDQTGKTDSEGAAPPDATMSDATAEVEGEGETRPQQQPKRRSSDSDGGTDSDDGAELQVHD